MANSLPMAVKGLILAALVASTLSHTLLQDDEDLTFDDEDHATKTRQGETVLPVEAPQEFIKPKTLAPVANTHAAAPPRPRPKRQSWWTQDTEDEVVEGSAIEEGSGFELPSVRTYRAKIHVLRPWDNIYGDRNTEEFRTLSRRIRSALEQIVDVQGDMTIQVVKFSRSPIGQLMAWVDIMHNTVTPQEEVILQRLTTAMRAQRLGDVEVNDQFFEFTEPRVSQSGPECQPGEWRCPEGSCVGRCDFVPECLDGSDERGCDGLTAEPLTPFPPPVTTPPPETTTTTKLLCLGDKFPELCSDGVTIYCQCDGTPQCPNGEDEENCRPPCPTGRDYLCGPEEDTCIYPHEVCDKKPDCFSGFDEENCPPEACEHPNFLCISLMCIPPTKHCDGVEDCDDGSDEIGCHIECPEGNFSCEPDNTCIPITQRCDGLVQCSDASDEKGCPCRENEWTCRDRSCIPENNRCNGVIDCPDTSDELLCPTPPAPLPPVGCRADEFTCRDGSCVPLRDRCDGTRRCPDGSDEEGCPPPPCGVNDFRCTSGQCIPYDRRCDKYADCDDSSDEFNCPPEGCADSEWTCNDGSCVSLASRCDGRYQCLDRSDEENCPPVTQTCRPEEFRCSNGSCISGNSRCDQLIDCVDGSDEEGCPARCRPGEFQCSDRSCIPEQSRCDGRFDCRDSSDEAGCPPPGCRSNEWECNSGQCIPIQARCNLLFDCLDRSDEENCPRRCQAGEFTCESDGSCVPEEARCDGLEQCRDGSDERGCPSKPTCQPDEFACIDDGTCIPRFVVCDGQPFCRDGSDEFECEGPVTCRPDQFRCVDGSCLEAYQKCNGYPECTGGEDEESCTNCQSGQFQCERDGYCIDQSQVCDSYSDCSDSSDELSCDPPTPPTPRPRPPQGKCNATHFECADGKCIPRAYRCDGIPDCEDASDEREQECNACRPDEFHCGSGECVPNRLRCDAAADCRDGSDERNCTGPSIGCSADEFQCGSGECISKFVVCDVRQDCFDGSDELDCDPQVLPVTNCSRQYEFLCGDGRCVDISTRCDGNFDCLDQSDEDGCSRCGEGQFQCDDGSCVWAESRCNGYPDCYDGSDETRCPATTTPEPFPPPVYCRAGDFQCNSGECVPGYLECDGRLDCRDGSDEIACVTTTTERPRPPPPPTPRPIPPSRPSSNSFRCQDGRIINGALRCNGRQDCADGSDEIGCGGAGELDLKTYPSEQTIQQTREVVFDCRDEGNTRAPVRWVRDGGRPLPPGSTDVRGRLTMPQIQLEHSGVYYCEAQGVPTTSVGWRRSVTLQVVPYTIPTVTPTTVCTILEATCMSGECINKTQVCDGVADCRDNSDEMRCSPNGCEPNEFQCNNRKCVLKTWLCDSDNDCGDNSDEQNCKPSPPGSQCHSKEFACQTGSQCIPKSFHCDGDVDCVDTSDEVGCSKPVVIEPPPRNVMVQVGETFTLTCRVMGIPTPIVLWRLNWGHIPAKCEVTSENGRGVLVCPNAQPTDQGAYSCEAINGKGSVFATPDAIVVVKGNTPVLCQPPKFNAAASNPNDCLNCFCFGATDECHSSDLYITQLPPPNSNSFTLVGANQDQFEGNYVVRDVQYPISNTHLARSRPGTQYSDRTVLSVDRSQIRGPRDLVIYFSLPDSHKGQQLASYGGLLRYKIRYSSIGSSQPASYPDVIIRGNNITLMHVHDASFGADYDNRVEVRFFYGQWMKRVVRNGEYLQSQNPATREEIMMVLENMDLLLIRALYTDGDFINTTLWDVQMDTADVHRTEQGQAMLVEQCTCPPGYTGISCQDCAPNYSRVQEGPWLGRCVSNLVCGPNEYGDPANNVPCMPCPCPLTTPNNQFSSSCFLDNDGRVTCNCQQGYEGRRCEYCASGYKGNPNVAGDYCKPDELCDAAGSVERNPVTGYCQCKEFTTGPRCDQCKNESFYLSERNSEGCIPCFCMGITTRCSSSNLYRQQESAYFTNDPQGFEIMDSNQQNFIRDDLFVDTSRQELVFQNFLRYGQKIYYWKLPQRFLGNKVTSYGGNLTYTLRFVPAPGGQSSTNNAYDVEIFGNDIVLRHFRKGQRPLSPTRQETVTVPLYEEYWQRQNGQEVNREHLMMALADLEHVHIKATYTTATEEVGLQRASMDFAESRNTGQERAHAVEMCECPPEYVGTSCEDCAVGYTRSLSGIHLGNCVPCDCNGHSTECDPNLGTCYNCKDNTAGEFCDLCAPGYQLIGNTCYRDDSSSLCDCDSRGTTTCQANRCICKANVVGPQCDSCRPGYFHLSQDNPEGCLSCWCSGVSSQCFSSNYYRMQLPMQLISDHGFTFSNRQQTDVIRDGFNINLANNEISFSSFDNLRDRETYFWSLPQMFTGNRLESYGGNLTVTQRYQIRPGGNTYAEPDIIIRSTGGREFIWMMPQTLRQNIENTYSVVLTEDHFTMNQQPASRSEFLKALSSIEAILIRATLSEQMTATFLSDVIMDTAVPSQTGQPRAHEVEQCRCPKEYSGLSCETCKPGHYRNSSTNQCFKCPCNGHESSCSERADGVSVQCECLPGYYGPSCGESDPPPPIDERPNIVVTISEPSIKVVTVNSTVQLACSARSVTGIQTRIPVTWSKVGGELPYGRSRDNRQGLLVISEVRASDSGVYICGAVDSYGRIVTENITLTVSRGPPVILLEPQSDLVDVSVRGSVVVRCSVDGAPQAQVTWTFGPNRQLPNNMYQQNGVLTLNDAQPSNTGEYHCSSVNTYGRGDARIYINVVSSPPSQPDQQFIIIQLSEKNVVARAGETVRVSCSVGSSIGSVTIEWNRLAGSLPSQSVVQDGELQIPGAQPVDSGIYVCRITQQRTSLYNEASTRITISQYSTAPTVQIQPYHRTVNQGANVEVFCQASGDPPPTITWTKDVNEDFSPRVSIENNVLRITGAQVSDRGMYMCTAQNDGGSAQGAAIIEVERREPPQIEMYPEVKQTIVVGGSALFQCYLRGGIPTPSVRWERIGGQPFTPNTETLSGGVLRFNQVRGDEEGSYICTAENDAGSVTATAVLEIQSLPAISIRPGPSPYTARIGEPVRLECVAEGDPAPSVTWKKLQVNYPTTVPGVTLSPGYSEYVIGSVSKADEGTYLCSAQNTAGTSEERIQLIVQDTLPATRPPVLPPPGPGQSYNGTTGDGRTVYVPAGSAYEFTCSSYGPEAEEIQFTFLRSDNRPLPAGYRTANNVLYLVNVDETASGEYACVGRDRITGVVRFTIYTTIEVIVPPRISLDPARQVVRPGEVVQIRCSATGPQPITITWTKEAGRMPASVIINGGELTFRGIATTDAGRYMCVAKNSGGTTRAVAEVVVNEEPLLTAIDPEMTLYVGQTAELRCETSGINPTDVRWTRLNGRLPPNAVARENVLRLPLIQVEDSGDYQCEAVLASGRRTYDVITLNVRSPQTTNIQIRSIPPDVRRGEDVELVCDVENEPAAAINWRRMDGELPYGAQTFGNRLRIPNAQSGGIYLCTATTRQGVFEERYGFIIRDIISETEDRYDSIAQQLRSENTRSVELGQSVTMECSLSLPGPVSYTWSKKDGKLPPNARSDSSVLDIREVRAEDAGVYVCTSSNNERSVDLPTLLIVTRVVPRFQGDSYLSMQTIPRAYLMFDLEISFKPESPNGLILYNSQHPGPEEGDFVAFGLVNGYPVFKFNIGAGPATITGTDPLQMNQWHTVKLSRNRKEGRMVVNDGEALIGVSQGRFLGLDLVEPLYLGGVPDFANVHSETGMTSGFQGCISRIVTGNTLNSAFVLNAVDRIGITSCQTCNSNPCQNNGVCQEAYNERGHRCFCPAGYLGDLCENIGESCYEGACGTGRCVNKPGGFECYCPFGKIGDRCEQDITIYEPAFGDESYIAYPTPWARRRFAVDMNFMPETLKDGVLMYCAQKESGSGDFTSLAIRDKRLEFQFNSGSGTAVIQSEPINEGEWIKVRVNRTDRMGSLRVNDGPVKSGESPGNTLGLNLLTPLFIGGIDNSRIQMAPDVGVTDGFKGCVSEIRLMDRDMPISQGLLDSANVGQCDGGASPCTRAPCQHGAACVDDPASPHGYSCHCPEGYSGNNCEVKPGVCNMVKPCTNGGACVGQEHDYACLCPIGYSGQHCEHVVPRIGDSAAFAGQSWVELNRTLLPQESDVPQTIRLEFRTRKPNSLLLWYGQDPKHTGKGQDYVSIAIKGGYVEFSYELGGGPAILRSQLPVDDGQFHRLTVERTGQQGMLTLDGEEEQVTYSPGNLHMLNANGNIYIGGVPDFPLMTGGAHVSGFVGCIQNLDIGGTPIDRFRDNALSGVNVIPCPRGRKTTRVTNTFEETRHLRNGRTFVNRKRTTVTNKHSWKN